MADRKQQNTSDRATKSSGPSAILGGTSRTRAEGRSSRDEGAAARVGAGIDQQGEAPFRLLVESVRDYAIFMLDPTGVVTTWNSGAERIKGYRADEIVGRHFSVFYPAEDASSGKCDYELDVATRDGRFEDEGWRVKKDGSRFWANVIITVLHDSDGKVAGFAKVTRDLTDRVRAERERLELVRAEADARRKDELVAVVGHELRNPLTALTTAVELIRGRGGQASEREVEILGRQLQQMKRIIDDLLDASRAEREGVDLRREPVSLGRIVADGAAVAAPAIESRGQTLRWEVVDNVEMELDRGRMAQVLGNLLNNAAKYTPPGGHIKVRAARSGDDDVEIVVEDDGQGIPKAMLERIFDLFARGNAGLEQSTSGLGIGLAVTRAIVRAHGGRIFAESEGQGKGSRFTVTLPRGSGKPSVRPSPSPQRSRGAHRRILVVEDNRDAAILTHSFLERQGHEVREAHDGSDALSVCLEYRPDVVLLDIGLPTMDGYEVARRLRRLPNAGAMRIVATSGYASAENKRLAIAAGCDAFFSKPVDMQELLAYLDAATP